MRFAAISGGRPDPPATLQAIVIDGEAAHAAAIASALQDGGVTTAIARGAMEGLRLLARGLPDLIVLDVEQPDASGWELLRRVRRLTDVPVLVASRRASDVDVARALALGADDYVAKPFSPLELEARAHALLRRAAAHAVVTPEPGAAPDDRRRTARTRAASSSGWNGLAT